MAAFLLGDPARLLPADVRRVRTEHGAVRQKEACVVIESSSLFVAVPPYAQLMDDLSVCVACKACCRWVHDNLPFSGSLELEQIVSKAQLLELLVGQRRLRLKHQPARHDRNFKRRIHGFPPILRRIRIGLRCSKPVSAVAQIVSRSEYSSRSLPSICIESLPPDWFTTKITSSLFFLLISDK